ncbi:Uncharacterised protein [Vibrio cholerae]|nr:Uncharacterised protein [Vibrio cholerae]
MVRTIPLRIPSPTASNPAIHKVDHATAKIVRLNLSFSAAISCIICLIGNMH